MGYIRQSDVTVTIDTDRSIWGRRKRHTGTIAFGNSLLVMGTGGIPMPNNATFGFIRELDELLVTPREGSSSSVYVYNKVTRMLVPTLGEPDSVETMAINTTMIRDVIGTTGGIDPQETVERQVLDFIAFGW